MELRVFSLALLSAALAIRVPPTLRGASPSMLAPASEPPSQEQIDVEATRDEAPAVGRPSFGDLLKGQRTPTHIQQAEAPTRDPAPRAPIPDTPAVLVQGGSLRTWTYANPALERVQVFLSSEGRPIDAEVELWQGPGNIPCKMHVTCEDGDMLPFSAVMETPCTFPGGIQPSLGEEGVVAKPRAVPSTVAVRNTGVLEFPFAAKVITENVERPSAECVGSPAEKVQGGALRTYPFDPSVGSVQVLLQTDGRPLKARIEILQGPNNNKQVVELYSEDGRSRPFFAAFETPLYGSVVRILNTASMEYPLSATVVPDSLTDFSEFDGLDDGLNAVGDPPRMGRYDTVY